MSKSIKFIGLDTAKDFHSVAIAEEGCSGEGLQFDQPSHPERVPFSAGLWLKQGVWALGFRPATALRLRSPRGNLRRVLSCTDLRDSSDQCVWNASVEREPQVPLLACIRLDLLHQLGVATDRWVDADVLLERSEVEQHAVELECRHSIADRFLRVGDCLANRRSNSL